MTTVYIDEAAGSDNTGRGTEDAPYQSLGHAIYAGPDTSRYLVRKDASGEYADPTQSSLKRAKKTADGLDKKRKKAEELKEKELAKDSEEREKREKLLEDSKKILLVEDETLPPAKRVRTHDPLYQTELTVDQVKISQLAEYRSQRIRVFGWVHRLRDQKGIIFIVLRDGTGFLQAVLSGKSVSQ